MHDATSLTPLALERFPEAFGRLRPTAAEPVWRAESRDQALAAFLAHGFPTRRHEEWKYTSVKSLLQSEFLPDSAQTAAELDDDALAALGVAELGGPRLVFAGGHLVASLSRLEGLPSGVSVRGLRDALTDAPSWAVEALRRPSPATHPFAALNAALGADGALVHVPAKTVVEAPVHLIFVGGRDGATVATPRVVVVLERAAELRLVETWVGAAQTPYFTNAVSELSVGEGARLEHTRVQREGLQASHVARVHARVGRDASFVSHNLSFGATLARHDIDVELVGPGASCALNGLYLASGHQHVDNHTSIDHQAPHGSSEQLYKGVLGDRATAVFNGKVFVRQDAQKTAANQSNKNLLSSERATVNTKPQLEIWADDVRCTHGATTGQLDDEALFYLRSRGVGLPAARQLLTYAFANDLIDRLADETLRIALEKELNEWLTTT